MRWDKNIFRKPSVIHPAVFAVYPVLHFYAYNIMEVSARQIVTPLIISVFLALSVWMILKLVLRSVPKAGFATSIFLFFFFSYGPLCDLLGRSGVPVKHWQMLPAVLLVFGYCVYAIKHTHKTFTTPTKMLNWMSVVMIAIILLNIGSNQVGMVMSQGSSAEQVVVPTDATKFKTMPDFYFIILDEYAHPDTIKEWYSYDKSGFITSLRDKGFFVANKSMTHSPDTPLAIAQVLNMEYLNDDPWSKPVFQKYACNEAANLLKTRGYKYIYFGGPLDNGRWDGYMKDCADSYYNFYETDNLLVSEFQNAYWNTTILEPIYANLTGSAYGYYHRQGLLSTLDHLKEITSLESPKFVFVHLLCPHTPFVFGPNGESVPLANSNDWKDPRFYLGQYIFIGQEIEKVVDSILKNSANQPIIVVQSDHGLRSRRDVKVGKDDWCRILNAIYLPDNAEAVLYDSISPVNTFRVIFNRYFDTNFDLLED